MMAMLILMIVMVMVVMVARLAMEKMLDRIKYRGCNHPTRYCHDMMADIVIFEAAKKFIGAFNIFQKMTSRFCRNIL